MLINSKAVILASGSPRRIDMLRADGIEPVIIKPLCDENIVTDMNPRQQVMALALRKNLEASAALAKEHRDGIVLSADTIVVYDGQVIGKPADERAAFMILSKLNGQKHSVLSGVCIHHPQSGRRLLFCCSTDVYFKEYTEEDIRAYISTGEPMDKAGAYAIQGGFAPYVLKICGSMDNVIGFPYQDIKKILSYW